MPSSARAVNAFDEQISRGREPVKQLSAAANDNKCESINASGGKLPEN